MEEALDKVHGKLFEFCDVGTRKMIRGLNHACALDIDVFTGLSVIVDDRFPTSIKFARSVRLNKMIIRNLRFLPENQNFTDSVWFFDPSSFETVNEISWVGLISFKWIEECVINFENLTRLYIGGAALDSPIFPNDRKSRTLTLPHVRSLEISSAEANYNMLHPSMRRKIFSDSSTASSSSDEERDEEEEKKKKMARSLSKNNKINPVEFEDVELGKSLDAFDSSFVDSTPVADNIYYLLSNLIVPKLLSFRLSYNEELYNIGELNWRTKPLMSFLQRHARTLQSFILDGEQNDVESEPGSLQSFSSIPDKLRYLFISIVEPPKKRAAENQEGGFLPLIKSFIGFRMVQSSSFWQELLSKQRSLEAIHCSVHAPWAWSTLSKVISKNSQFLHTINIGCHWPDPNVVMDMDIISRCVFLKKLTFNVTTTDPEKRCRISNLSSLLACVLLESVFITHALCDTEELEVFSHLPSLSSLVLMYVGKMSDCGVTVGILQDFLRLRTLNLLIVVEFYKQKHCINAHLLRRILRSEVNTTNCPIFSRLVPYASTGNYVYVGNITEALVNK